MRTPAWSGIVVAMENRARRARRRPLLVVHAVLLLAGLAVIVLSASPVRFYGWSWDFSSEWFTLAMAALFGGLVGAAERVASAGGRSAAGYLVLVAGSVPALWLPLVWVTAEKELGDPFGSWSDVIDAGVFWTLFLVVVTAVASRPWWRGRRSAGTVDR
jgi:hypothetical protein